MFHDERGKAVLTTKDGVPVLHLEISALKCPGCEEAKREIISGDFAPWDKVSLGDQEFVWAASIVKCWEREAGRTGEELEAARNFLLQPTATVLRCEQELAQCLQGGGYCSIRRV